MSRPELKKKVSESFRRLLAQKKYVAPIDLFVDIGKLTKTDVENWRNRRIPCIEPVVVGILSMVGFILRTLRDLGTHANLKPSRTVYHGWGKSRGIPLRFGKFGDPNVETAWSTHYVNTYRPPEIDAEQPGDRIAHERASVSKCVKSATSEQLQFLVQDNRRVRP